MRTADDLQRAIDEIISDGARRGVMHQEAEDTALDGRVITVRGSRLVNFGSCSYLGWETHPSLVDGVVAAVRRYGSQFSSSRAYLSAPGYRAAEELLGTLFGRPAVITASTTLGHLAAIPTFVGAADALLLDHQAHASVQTAAKLARAQGATVELVPHSNVEALERRVAALAPRHRRVYYAGDGLYSMYADFAPLAELAQLLDRYESMWLYLDDAHGVSWSGRYGRGHVLDQLPEAARSRTIVAASLNKSFAASGAAILLPDEESRRRLFTVGGPMIFSGPVQPPMLGAIAASARLHLSELLPQRQAELTRSIRLFNSLATEHGLPLTSMSEAPIRCVGVGTPELAYQLADRLRAAGHFVDTATFPAVPPKRSGTRISLTTHHRPGDIESLVEAIATALPEVLADGGSSVAEVERAFSRQLAGRPVRLRPGDPHPNPSPAFTVDHHRSVTDLDPGEWDRLLGDRGAFSAAALRSLERTFAPAAPAPDGAGGAVGPAGADRWQFHYWIVRDRSGHPVLATFFTAALWKLDMLSPAPISAEVERRRHHEPNFLTAPVLAMGSLLTEGNHLYLDRSGPWRGALRALLRAVRAEEDRIGASAIVLRDLPDGDSELHELLLGEGFLRLRGEDAWSLELQAADDAALLAALPKKSRQHLRRTVLAWEPRYQVEHVRGGSPDATAMPAALVDQLYQLYRNVHGRNLGLNVFPLPRRILDVIRTEACWELTILRVDGDPRPVAFLVTHLGTEATAPVFLGLDYTAVVTHHAYQQLLWQTVRSARRHRGRRILLGLSAGFHKARLGARAQPNWIYVQPTDTFQTDLLTHLAEGVQAGTASAATTPSPRPASTHPSSVAVSP